ARAAGRNYEPPLDHPLLEEALAETLGVILYQDQVLQVCQALAGFTAGQAEALRRAMSRRRSREMMAEFWEEFRDGAAARGVPETTAERVFTQVIAFSEFGFPKSHAAAFGLLAYQSAWLRHYHPAEYYCALFNNQPMGFYSLDALGRDANRNDVGILLPDVNASDVWCTIERDAGCEMRDAGAVRVGSGLFGTGARRRRPSSCSSGSGAGCSRASATWRAGRRPGSSAPRSNTSCGWAGATAWGSPGGSCCGRWDCGCRPRRRATRTPACAASSSWRSTIPTRGSASAASRRRSGCSLNTRSSGSRRAATRCRCSGGRCRRAWCRATRSPAARTRPQSKSRAWWWRASGPRRPKGSSSCCSRTRREW